MYLIDIAMLKKQLKLLVILFFLGFVANAQNRKLSGSIADANGPLPGASVVEQGTSNAATSDIDGSFQIQLTTTPAVLIVSYIGYASKRVTVENQTTVNIVLDADVNQLDDVVIVGFGTKKKVNLTGAVSEISASDIDGKPVVNAYQALQGEASGLIIQQNTSAPGSVSSINIRGVNTINGNTPLVVVDGVPGSLNNINPNDIQSISILKDAASASIYGSRAASGVILVTTKSGKEGKPKFVYSTMFGMQEATNFPKFANSWQYATLRNEALVNSGMAPAFTQEQILGFKENGPNVNWNEALYKDFAMQSSHNLSLSGSDNGLSYMASLGYVDQESMFKGPDYGYQRYNARMNFDKIVNDKLKVGGRMSFARNDIKDHAYYTDFIIEPTVRTPPIYNIIDEDGNYTLVSGSNSNPLAQLKEGGSTRYQNDEVLATFTLDYEPIKNLVLHGVIGGNVVSNKMHQFRRSIAYVYPGGGNNQNSVSDSYSRTLYINPYLTATYKKTFAEKHNFDIMAGTSSETSKTEFFGVTGLNVPGNNFGVINNTQELQRNGTYGSGNEWSISSFFGRLGYNFSDRYLFEANLRYDGSSRFSTENRWGVFPSVSAGWVVSEEAFFAPLKDIVSFAKVRASWGQVGNQDINDLYGYQSLVSTSSNVYSFGGGSAQGAYYSVSNGNRTWETTTMKNIGVDFSFFNKKLDLSFDVFENLTEDILLQLPVPATYGLGQPFQNAGSVSNKGWDISAGYRFQTGDFNHGVKFNISDTQNIVENFRGREYINGSDVQTILKEGYPINSYYALWSDGFYNSAEEVAQSATPIFATSVKPGDIRYVDRNNDGKIDYENDRFIFGNAFPRYTYGFTYDINYKHWDFSFFIQGVGKRQQWLRGEIVEAFHNNNEGPVLESHLDRWTPNNLDASYPRLTVGSESINNAARSDFYIHNAQYLRLKNVQLGYTLTREDIPFAGIESFKIYATGFNLLTVSPLTKFGVDPEAVDASGRAYPVARVWSLGLNVNF
ncbi:SusC/RagA family TonB-linked outer membrane protein [Flavobacterium rhizosphaerae]|uniref:TonB-dependent receptor n=1 Tax=Flavobacterium rhizosphaerae TaxID=3163298 RepID=A0ABW8YYI4_9FLAO